MRLSVREDDPGYIYPIIPGKFVTYLDGKRITKVLTADEEAGTVLRYKTETQKDGTEAIFVNEAQDGAIEETLHGHVVIVNTHEELNHDASGKLQ